MYPRIVEIPLPFEILGSDVLPIHSYGMMMAIGFLVAAWLVRRELDWLYSAGELESVLITVKKGPRKGSKVSASPSALVGDIVVIAVIGGLAGARIFHILENLDDFSADPLGMIFSTSGLTFYGGLFVAAGGVLYYVRKYDIHLPTFADAALPTVLLAYGIGRIGCHLAGDGDWGITADVAAKPGIVPMWLWAETYPNNILGRTLPDPGVYPTAVYEFVMAVVLFGIAWALRRHPFRRGWLTSVTVLFFGVERILIEQIRVNNTFQFFGMTVTQAELISACMILAGVAGLVMTTRRKASARMPAQA